MQTLLLNVFAGAVLAASTPAQNSLLQLVPDNSSIIVYCDSWSNFQERSERNLWTEAVAAEEGGFVWADVFSCYDLQLPRETEALYPIAKSLRGETVMFFTPGVVSLFTEVKGSMMEAQAAFAGWLPEETPEWPRIRQQVADAQVEMVSWPDGGCSRNAKFVAYVDHPSVLGLVAANDLQELTRAVTETITRLAVAELSTPVQGMLEARKTAASIRGIEFYVDFTSYAQEADEALRDAMKGMLPDPKDMLGLDRGVWLHANFDFAGERRIDCNARLNIPKDTLLAKLADCYGPLPANLPTRLPRDLASLWSLQWDLEKFYKTLRNSFVERHGKESVQMLDAGMAAAEGATGVNTMDGIIAPLEGLFAFYGKSLDSTHDSFQRCMGLLIGLDSMDSFQEAIENLIDMALGDALELTDQDGADVYLFKDDDFLSGGMALLPREFLVTLNPELLREHVDAIHQVEGSNLAMSGAIGPIFDQHQGSTFFACARLGWLREINLIEHGSEPRKPSAERVEFLQPFMDSHAIANAVRTPEGFRFRFEVR